MRKSFLTYIVLLFFIVSSLGGVTFAENVMQKSEVSEKEALLSAIGLLSDEVKALEDDSVITRGQLAFSCAGLLNFASQTDAQGYFTDVTKDNIYFSAIEVLRTSGLVSGKAENMYYPNDNATVDEAVKILSCILGYDELAKMRGGYPDGYRKIAELSGLYKNAYGISGELLKKNLVAILANALEAEPQNVVYREGIKINDESKTSLMENNLKVFKYSGKIVKVNGEDYSVSMLIEKNDNHEILSGYDEGETVRLKVSTDIDINLYENVPMDFWVNSDEEVILMLLDGNVSVKYATVYSVNDDADEEHKYRVDKIDEITILNDEKVYGIHEDFSVKYNGNIVSASVGLAGKFAKIVTQNDEILFVESWDMTEGGLITEITYENISYMKGENNCILEDFNKFTNRVVIIDGKGSTVEDMKTGAYFSYYKSGDNKTIVIAMSDIVITDTLYSFDDESVDIGNMNFDTSKNLYCFTEMEELRSTVDKSKLLNMMVAGHLDHHGRVAYIVLSNDEAEKLAEKEFVGYLKGKEDEQFGNIKVSIIVLRDEPEEIIFKMAEKVKTEDDLILEDVLASGGKLTTESVYKFTLNKDAEISKIAKMSPYYGFGEAVCTPTSFVQSGNPHMTLDGVKLFFDKDTPIYALYENEGEQTAKRYAWDDLMGGTCSNITMKFYGEEEESDVTMIILTGNIKSIKQDSTYIEHGILKDKTTVIDESGKTACKLFINNETYVVSEEVGNTLKVPSYVRYAEGSFAGDDDINIIENFELSGSFESWSRITDDTKTTQIKRGVVKKLDGKRLYLEDGSVYFMYPKKAVYMECGTNNRFDVSSYQTIGAGKEVVYSLYDNCVFMVFYH